MEKTGKLMWLIFWTLVLIALAYYFNGVINEKYNPNQQVQSVDDTLQPSIILKQNNQGHYIATGTINGEPVTFLLDTGATLISIPLALQKRLHLHKGDSYPVSTANGLVDVFATDINSLQIGTLVFNNLKGHLNPGINGNTILLGMNALKHLDMRQVNNTLTLTIPTHD